MKMPRTAKEETIKFLQDERARLTAEEEPILLQLVEIQYQIKYVDSLLETLTPKPAWKTQPVPAPEFSKRAKKKAPKRKAPVVRNFPAAEICVTDEELVDAYFAVAAGAEITVRQWTDAINLRRAPNSGKKASTQAVRNKVCRWKTCENRPYRIKGRRADRNIFYTMEKVG